MKKLIAAIALSLMGTFAVAAEGPPPLDKAPNHMNDMEALRSGARLFVNYCLNCHSAQAMRFNRLRDLGLSNEEIEQNLLFTTDKVGDLMTIAMRPNDAKVWFGKAPPDLSLITRSRSSHSGTGADYVYTYLRSYYRDQASPTGWNNTVFPSVGMPHVLWERQGPREVKFETVSKVGDTWERVTTEYDQHGFATTTKVDLGANYTGGASAAHPVFNALNPDLASQYDKEVGELTGFLSYVAEPGASKRLLIGKIVLIFLAVFAVVAWRLNASFWKDIK